MSEHVFTPCTLTEKKFAWLRPVQIIEKGFVHLQVKKSSVFMSNFESDLLLLTSLPLSIKKISLRVPVHRHFSLYLVSYMNCKSLPAPASYNKRYERKQLGLHQYYIYKQLLLIIMEHNCNQQTTNPTLSGTSPNPPQST